MTDEHGWVVEEPPDIDEDGNPDMGGAGMIVRAPNGKRYTVITPDMVEVPDGG